MKRIFLFIVTNLAVLAVLSVAIFVIERVFGVRLPQNGLGGLTRLFMSHPPLDARIAALPAAPDA
jgi:hypothetical protein